MFETLLIHSKNEVYINKTKTRSEQNHPSQSLHDTTVLKREKQVASTLIKCFQDVFYMKVREKMWSYVNFSITKMIFHFVS